LAAKSRFEFQKRRQLFIRTHDEPLSVTMRVSNPDGAASQATTELPGQALTEFAEIVSDDLPINLRAHP
jgi:hypothetical protein